MTQTGLTADSEARHEQFLDRVVASGVVWGLKSAEGWVVSSSTADETEDAEIMPFWSDRAYAKQCATDDWSVYAPTEIPLDLFMKHWLPGMANDQCLVGTNWNAHMVGYEIAPLDLLEEFEEALKEKK
jgi:hypothetical protein